MRFRRTTESKNFDFVGLRIRFYLSAVFYIWQFFEQIVLISHINSKMPNNFPFDRILKTISKCLKLLHSVSIISINKLSG